MIHVDVIFVLYYFHLMRSLAHIQFYSIEDSLHYWLLRQKMNPSQSRFWEYSKNSFDILEVRVKKSFKNTIGRDSMLYFKRLREPPLR